MISALRVVSRIVADVALHPTGLRTLSTGVWLRSDRFVAGKKGSKSLADLRGKLIDESDSETINIDALAKATGVRESDAEEEAESTEPAKEFAFFPDGDTLDALYGGVKFRDLPYVHIICAPNNTKFWALDAAGNKLEYHSPRKFGFLHATKRTTVAAQMAGMNMGQLLRGRGITTIRVRLDGFNNGRIAGIKGLVQAGIRVVSISDVTPIPWNWCQRAKKPKRRR